MVYIWLTKQSIQKYLSKRGKIKNTKDGELVVAIILNKFCEKQWGGECIIGLELSNKHAHLIPLREAISFKKLEEYINKMVEECTPVDIAIGENKKDGLKIKALCFQIKRFGRGLNQKTTDELISYINSHCKNKYAKNRARLAILLETDKEINFNLIKEKLRIFDFPFEAIMIIWKKDSFIHIGELYPQWGMETLSMEEILN